jgi:hypothetical protein
MILVDSSAWIHLLQRGGTRLQADDFAAFCTCSPVLQEVLQGLLPSTKSSSLRWSLLQLPRLCDPLDAALFLEAADIYSFGRRKGFTIRSSVDCLIAAIAIENKVPVWHRDRDFRHIARYTKLTALDSLAGHRPPSA